MIGAVGVDGTGAAAETGTVAGALVGVELPRR